MAKRLRIGFSTVALHGNPNPQAAARDGQAWFLWSATSSRCGVRLEPVIDADNEPADIVLAAHRKRTVETVCVFPGVGETARPLSLCVSPKGPIALWLCNDGQTSRLMAGDADGNAKTLCEDERVWDAEVTALEDGTVLAGIIRLCGKRPHLQFYRMTMEDGLGIEPVSGLEIHGAWSLSMRALEGARFWLAFDSYQADRFQVAAGTGDLRGPMLTVRPLPGTGFATMPQIAALADGTACVVWSEDKAWGAHEYDFKRKSRLKLAQMTPKSLLFCEDVPLRTEAWDDDEQQMPCSPTAVALQDGLHVFFRRPRAAITGGTRVNDWGWQIWESVRDWEGGWHEAAIFSQDVGMADDPLQPAPLAEGQAALIYHSCSYDQRRSYVHGHRLHLGVHNGGAPGPVTEPVACPDIARELRPRLPERPRTEVDGEALSCYWGDLHRHSLVSKCIPEHDGSYRDHARFALGCRGFDFYSITDHIEAQISHPEWRELLALIDRLNEDGSFAAVYGFEGPSSLVRGHLNFYFLDREAAEFGYRELRWMSSLKDVQRTCRQRGLLGRVLCVRHFHADALAFDDIVEGPTQLDPELDPVVEVVQGRGYSPKATRALLTAGYRFGFMGSSDHNRPPGHPNRGVGIYEQAIAGIWAPTISRKSLFDAFFKRRCFSSNGPRLAVCLRVNGTFMGGVASAQTTNTVHVDIEPSTELTETRLFRDGEEVAVSYRTGRTPLRIEFSDTPSAAGEHCYYAEVRQRAEPGLAYPGIAWTSPVWTTG